jgi:hypothetical protein
VHCLAFGEQLQGLVFASFCYKPAFLMGVLVLLSLSYLFGNDLFTEIWQNWQQQG